MKQKASGIPNKRRGYIYCKQLSFLRNVVKPTKRSNDSFTTALSNIIEQENTGLHSEEMEYNTANTSTFEDAANNYNTLQGGLNEEDFSLPPDLKETNSSSQFCAFQANANPSRVYQDCDTLFLMSLAKDLKSIPEEERLEVKIELMKVLSAAKRRFQKGKSLNSDYQNFKQNIEMTMKDEADSDSVEDIEGHSLDSFREPTDIM